MRFKETLREREKMASLHAYKGPSPVEQYLRRRDMRLARAVREAKKSPDYGDFASSYFRSTT